MELVHVIRHKVRVEGLSVRRVAQDLGLSRNTVRRYLRGAEPGVAKPRQRTTPVLDKVRERLDALLRDSSVWTGGKQRLTAARVHELLVEEGFEVGATLVKSYVREWRRQQREVFVPLTYPPGDSAQVDFFEVLVDIDGARSKAWMFVLRLMYSKRDFVWLYPRQDQICFLDGHVRAFAHFGAVPHRVVYDNLKAAVARQLAGSERVLAPRFAALSAHYGFEPCFARPYTGHDKGGVESRGKAIRLQHMVPIPAGPDLHSISRELLDRIDARTDPHRFDEERVRMIEAPPRPFRASKVQPARVSRAALVKVEGAVYSVGSRWAGLDVTVYIGPGTIEIEGPDGRVEHPRLRLGQRAVDYRHYLPELAHKPQAVRQVAAELIRDLGPPYARIWRELVDAHGPKQASRIFAKILEAIVERGHDEVVRCVEDALRTHTPIPIALRTRSEPSTSLGEEALPEALARVRVHASSIADYDVLLGDER
jgi:transposase